MRQLMFRALGIVFTIFALTFASSGAGAAQESPFPCMKGVAIQPLAQAMPPDADGMALVGLRLTIEPEGGFAPHTHPGIVTVNVDSGELTFTLLEDDDMQVNRTASDGTPVPPDTITPNEAIVVQAGDWFVETGSVHQAFNQSNEPTVVLISALVDPSEPFVQCVES